MRSLSAAEMLLRLGAEGDTRICELADRCGVRRSNINVQTNALERAGLVERKDRSNEPGVVLGLTRKGRNVWNSVAKLSCAGNGEGGS